MTPGQVADLLQVSVPTVYRWAAADPTMPTLRIGGIVRFPRERLERWLREREQGLSGRRRSPKQVLGALQVSAAAAGPIRAGATCTHPCDQKPLR
jgi:excisionase family DNA binding protein